MIRINLLPTRARQKADAGMKMLLLFVILLAGVGFANYMWYADKRIVADALGTQIERAKKDIQDLDKVIAEVKDINAEQKVVQEKLDAIEKLRKGRLGPVKLLDAMDRAKPLGVWLRQIAEKKDEYLIEASGLSNDDVAEYMSALSAMVWTPEGIGRQLDLSAGPDARSRVQFNRGTEMLGVKEYDPKEVAPFFSSVVLKKSSQRKDKENSVVEFSLALKGDSKI